MRERCLMNILLKFCVNSIYFKWFSFICVWATQVDAALEVIAIFVLLKMWKRAFGESNSTEHHPHSEWQYWFICCTVSGTHTTPLKSKGIFTVDHVVLTNARDKKLKCWYISMVFRSIRRIFHHQRRGSRYSIYWVLCPGLAEQTRPCRALRFIREQPLLRCIYLSVSSNIYHFADNSIEHSRWMGQALRWIRSDNNNSKCQRWASGS